MRGLNEYCVNDLNNRFLQVKNSVDIATLDGGDYNII